MKGNPTAAKNSPRLSPGAAHLDPIRLVVQIGVDQCKGPLISVITLAHCDLEIRDMKCHELLIGQILRKVFIGIQAILLNVCLHLLCVELHILTNLKVVEQEEVCFHEVSGEHTRYKDIVVLRRNQTPGLAVRFSYARMLCRSAIFVFLMADSSYCLTE